MQRVYGYIRVSTERQAEEGVSLEAQRARIQAYADANGLEVAGFFTDEGLSGKRADNRPHLQEALAAVCGSKGILVTYSLSRLSRSTKDTILIAERLEKSGADLVSLTEKIDTTSAAGRMLFRMLAVLAEFERDLVSERTTTALRHKQTKGERVGQIPFGFDVADDGVTLVPNPAEQQALQLIGELNGRGLSLRAIAAELRSRGITTKEGATAWNPATISRILKRTAV